MYNTNAYRYQNWDKPKMNFALTSTLYLIVLPDTSVLYQRDFNQFGLSIMWYSHASLLKGITHFNYITPDIIVYHFSNYDNYEVFTKWHNMDLIMCQEIKKIILYKWLSLSSTCVLMIIHFDNWKHQNGMVWYKTALGVSTSAVVLDLNCNYITATSLLLPSLGWYLVPGMYAMYIMISWIYHVPVSYFLWILLRINLLWQRLGEMVVSVHWIRNDSYRTASNTSRFSRDCLLISSVVWMDFHHLVSAITYPITHSFRCKILATKRI